MKKRILVLLSVVVLMVAMLTMSVGPVFAASKLFSCFDPTGTQIFVVKNGEAKKLAKSGYTCIEAL